MTLSGWVSPSLPHLPGRGTAQAGRTPDGHPDAGDPIFRSGLRGNQRRHCGKNFYKTSDWPNQDAASQMPSLGTTSPPIPREGTNEAIPQ